tara:strand:- start:605 stop:3004 length:2400 start_codon:yes stop_codon:yes gene_type:complete
VADQEEQPSPKSPWVGRSISRREDERLLRGAGRFAADENVPGQLHAAILHSPHAHARIVNIDTTIAEAMPGVEVVVTGQSSLDLWQPLPPSVDLVDMRLPETYSLATEIVHYVGEPVAAVAASDPYLAQDAANAISVSYEILEPILDRRKAIEPDSPLVYPDWPDNRQCLWEFSFGSVDEAFENAEHVVSRDVAAHRYSAVPMEMRALVSRFDPVREELTVRVSTQIPHQARTVLSWIFGLSENNIHILAEDVGGGFGNKLQLDVEPIPILLSIMSGKAVKWVERRDEWLTSAPASRDFEHRIEGAFSSDGELLAVRDHLIGDVGCDGAVRAGGAGALLVAGTYGPGPYKVQRYSTKVEIVVTNKAPYGAYRGFGKDVANLAMEFLMDEGAKSLGIDPLELRRRNLVDNYPYEMATGPLIESGSFLSCLAKVEKAMDLPALKARQKAGLVDGKYFGYSVISVLEPSAATIPNSLFTGYESATVRLSPSGDVTVLTGMMHIGQGIETAAAQVTADLLGVIPESVRIVSGNTDSVPYGLGSFSSRGATYGLSAIHDAALMVRKKLLKAAANLLETDVTAVEIADGFATVIGAPEKTLSIPEIAKAVYFFPGPYVVLPDEKEPTLEAQAVWTNPQVSWTPDVHGRIRMYPAHASGAQGATVTVDPETGQVVVEDLWISHDSGKMIHPKIVEGQIIGGTIQGFGGVMMEQLAYDQEGNMLSQTLADYQLPNFLSAPPVHVLHGEVNSPVTPLGTKGVGEAGAIGTPTVLMMAVENALAPLGVSVASSPLTPERVLKMIEGEKV